MITFQKTNYIKREHRAGKIICACLLAIVISYVSIVVDGIFHISDLFSKKIDVVVIAACVITALAVVVITRTTWLQLGDLNDFAEAIQKGIVEEAKLSYLGKIQDFSRETDYDIPRSEFWELDVALRNKNRTINHAILRVKRRKKTDISCPEIDIVSKTISVPYGFDKTEIEKMEIDVDSLKRSVGI